MAYVTLSTVMVLLGFQSPWILIQFGWLVAWVYLRFYKKNRGDSVVGDSYGDRSETFAFIYWFPPFLQCVSSHSLNDLITYQLLPQHSPRGSR